MRVQHFIAGSIALAIGLLAATAGTVSLIGAAGQTDPQGVTLPPQLAEAAEGEKVTYWIVLRERADLRPARAMSHDARGAFVVERLQATAERSQVGLREFLRARGADFTPFWAANVIKVTSDKATLTVVARRPDVERIEADVIYTIPEPLPGVAEPGVESVEWNIANVRAQEVWTTFGTRGEGIVVGSIDTGAQYDHPALVNQYRGNLGGGTFDHNYNWFDPSAICGNPSTTPCDNNNHGTHTMGTIAGDDGGANQIGVAPGARWITAKGCESSSCSITALVAAGQWMLAPTDLAGGNPRPDLRPHVVSNSWGGASGDTFYQQIVQSWVAAGIVPVFANGNSGPACGSVSSPGDYPESYGVGAYDASNLVASFSGRGASRLGGVKPNISAPGVNVRSSIAGSSYAAFSGTSMATPHIAGIVALMWSAAPSLVGDVTATRSILDQTAIDTPDSTCGGTAGNNNVYGEGRVDAFAAVDQSPRGPTGTLSGTVTNAATGSPVAAAQVRATGPSNRSTVTNGSGGYTFTLPVGAYDLTVSAFGYLSQTIFGVEVVDGGNTVQNVVLVPAPSVVLSGTVRDGLDAPVANATVTIAGTPIPPALTDVNGAYRFDAVPAGTYDVTAGAGRCNDPLTQTLALATNQVVDFVLPARSDAFGYACRVVPQAWIDAANVLALTGDDAYVQVALPFSFGFYGGQYSAANISSNGVVTFVTPSAAYANTAIPSVAEPNAAVYVLWDDLYLDASSSVRTATIGTAPTRQFVIEWRNIAFYGDLASRVDLELALGESGDLLVQYRNISGAREQGNSATTGLENTSGNIGFQYSLNEAALADGLSIRYAVTPFTGVQGTITDANDRLALSGATVRALQIGAEVQRATTDVAGYYHFHLPEGTYAIEGSVVGYETASSTVTVTSGATTQQPFSLRTPLASVAPASLSFMVFVGQTASQALALGNAGGLAANWQLVESGSDVPWLSESPTAGSLAPGAAQPVQVTANAAGLAGGTYYATLLLQSDSGRRPSISVPVSMTVSQYAQAGNAGGPTYYGSGGFYWWADAVYTAGSWGYTNARATADATKRSIAGTQDVTLYQTQRVDPVEYRFDGLVAGTYQVTVGFAEFRKVKRGARVFDVVAEGITILAAHDVMTHAETFVADVHTFDVAVNDGQLNLFFTPRGGTLPPIVNAVRVAQLR